jgi:transposase
VRGELIRVEGHRTATDLYRDGRLIFGSYQCRASGLVIVTPPGEEAQVDHGGGPMVRDRHSGRYPRTRLFVLMLGYRRKAVRPLIFQSNSRMWAELHERACRRLGGACRVIVLDNLGEGVLKPDIYDPAVNPLYRDLLAHYGAIAIPCRVAHENGVVSSAPKRSAYTGPA